MSEFKKFGTAVGLTFAAMAKSAVKQRQELYVVDATGDELWEHYLKSFPEGSNPIYKTRTEHDCSCCRQFVKAIGGVVFVTAADADVLTVWDYSDLPYPYNEVTKSMADFVRNRTVKTVFRATEMKYGAERTIQSLGDGETKAWNHFYAEVPKEFVSRTRRRSVDEERGNFNTAQGVLKRGLDEIMVSHLDEVIGLINAKALYRGKEHLASVLEFRRLAQAYAKHAASARHLLTVINAMLPVARFRNTVIGTLLVDLASGVGLEDAVRSFETKVAPANYKRPTALITPRMIADAQAKIDELGLSESLKRRLAVIGDVNVNDVLWVDSRVKPMMAGIAAVLGKPAKVKSNAGSDITVDEFFELLPQISELEAWVGHTELSAFMTLTTAIDASAPNLFKWNNPFAWSYSGDVTDSIREKVKKAGGNVEADLRFSLAWFNYDDLDIHVTDPKGRHIYFGNKMGILDVDMNAGHGSSREAVENMAFDNPIDGKYVVEVQQYNKRENKDFGFVIEVANAGAVNQYRYDAAVANTVRVGEFIVKDGVIVETRLNPSMHGGGISANKWGISTENYHRVTTVLTSPNHWGGQAIGNKHWFFILEGAKTDEPVRGFYNEFLDSRLETSRKVFEVLGDKMKCTIQDEQLSGVGFSSTKPATLRVSAVVGGTKKFFTISF